MNKATRILSAVALLISTNFTVVGCEDEIIGEVLNSDIQNEEELVPEVEDVENIEQLEHAYSKLFAQYNIEGEEADELLAEFAEELDFLVPLVSEDMMEKEGEQKLIIDEFNEGDVEDQDDSRLNRRKVKALGQMIIFKGLRAKVGESSKQLKGERLEVSREIKALKREMKGLEKEERKPIKSQIAQLKADKKQLNLKMKKRKKLIKAIKKLEKRNKQRLKRIKKQEKAQAKKAE